MNKSELEAVYQQKEESFLSSWQSFLRFKSISADSAFERDCVACAEWLLAELKHIGFEGRLIPTAGKPLVFAERIVAGKSPTVLYYGHYDVQPPEPLELWNTPPFEPCLKDGRLYARGAQDNKGQTSYFISALKTLIEKSELNVSIKILIEGEEESGSLSLGETLAGLGGILKSDVLMVCDTGMLQAGKPAITMGLRGLIHLGLRLKGPLRDLHSGVHGGVIKNPATEMARLIASLHNADGSIAVKGYYDYKSPLSAADFKLCESEPFLPSYYEQKIGAPPNGGESKLSFWVRRGLRPTIEINGINSGYQGLGHKTIIPAEAACKITSRLVVGQDPEKALQQLIAHLESHLSLGLRMEFEDQGVGGPAMVVSADSTYVKKAAKTLELISERGISYIYEGASIPIIPLLAKISQAEPVLVGFGLEEDYIHAPNESFSLEQFRQGFMYSCLFLQSLGGK